MTLYETLGVQPNATPEEIKKAYKKKASAHHPDRGGDGSEMTTVNEARDLLLVPERRKRYDDSGFKDTSVKPEVSIDALAEQRLFKAVSEMIAAVVDHSYDSPSLCQDLRVSIGNHTTEVKAFIKHENKRVKRMERLKDRIKRKDGAVSIYEAIMLQNIAKSKAALATAQLDLEINALVIEKIDQLSETRGPYSSSAGLDPGFFNMYVP